MTRPPLTQKIAGGVVGGGPEFVRLLQQLLQLHGQQNGYVYEPLETNGGPDGIVRSGGVPGLDGPVAFQIKWLWDFDKTGKSRTAKRRTGKRRAELEAVLESPQLQPEIQHAILVTPCDLAPGEEQDWFRSIPVRDGFTIHHWGQTQIDQLLELAPALDARYYPEDAGSLLPGYEGFDLAAFATEYRDRLAAAHGEMRVLGRQVRLREIFVPPRLLHEGQQEAQPLHQILARRRSRAPAYVVLGDPGSGKTTLLTFLTLFFAGAAELPEYQPRGPDKNKSKAPLLVPLRDYVLLLKSHSDLTIVDYLTYRAQSDHEMQQAHRAFFESVLSMGEAIVLFDGLDEAGGEKMRHHVAEMVRDFRDNYPNCSVWVTSRIYGYTEEVALSKEDFVHLRIAAMDDAQVDNFITRWHDLRFPEGGRDRDEQEAMLKKAVRQTESVRELACNPLLLTLMAFIHQGTRRLPHHRGDIYENCIEVLLKTWLEEKLNEDYENVGHPGEELGLHLTTQKDYLAHLALAAQEHGDKSEDEDGRGLIVREEAIAALTARHLQIARRTRPRLGEETAQQEMTAFLDYIVDRTGLIIDRGGDRLSFVHISFQEYLSAWVFTTGTTNSVAFFTQHIGSTIWQEVLLLRLYIILCSPGGGGPEVFDNVIGAVLKKLDTSAVTRLGQVLGFGFNREQGWLTMTRAICDGLDFTPEDKRTILNQALAYWSQEPQFQGTWYEAVEKVIAHSPRDIVREAIWDMIKSVSGRDAVAGLYLARLHQCFPRDTADYLRTRVDLRGMLADLIFFVDDPGIEQLLVEHSNIHEWARVRTAVDSPAAYMQSLDLAMSPDPNLPGQWHVSVVVLWRKILANLVSRRQFANALRRSDAEFYVKGPGRLLTKSRGHTIEMPFSALLEPTTLLARRKQERESLLCPALATHHQPASHEGLVEDPYVQAWTERSIHDWLASSNADTDLIHQLAADMAQRAFPFDFNGEAIHWFLGYFSRNIDTNFFRYFELIAGRSLGGKFGRELERSFDRSFAGAVAPHLDSALARFFARSFFQDTSFDRGKFLLEFGIDADADDPKGDLFKIVEDEAMHPQVLGAWQFWHVLAGQSIFAVEHTPSEGSLSVKIESPVATPWCMLDIWRTAALSHMFNMVRDLITRYQHEFPASEVTGWLSRNPFQVYGVALSWAERARVVQDHLGGLNGPRGALLLAHAAYAVLNTGLPLDGPEWDNLVRQRDRRDPLVEVSYLFYEICRFQDSELATKRLLEIVQASSGQLRELFEAAGLTV